jgi:hypothetical protein
MRILNWLKGKYWLWGVGLILVLVLFFKIYGALFPIPPFCSKPYFIDYYRASSNPNIRNINFEKLLNELKKDNWQGYYQYLVQNPKEEKLDENGWKVYYYAGFSENKRNIRAQKEFSAPLVFSINKVRASLDYDENFAITVSSENPTQKPIEQVFSLYINGGTKFDTWLVYKTIIKNINELFNTGVEIKNYSEFPFERQCD